MGKYFGNNFGGKYFSVTNEHGRFPKYHSTASKLSVEDKIKEEEAKLQQMGVTPPPESSRSMLDRIFDTLSIGQYATLGALKNATDKDKSTTALQGLIGGLKAGLPIGRGYEQGEASTSDVLNNLGWKQSGQKQQNRYFNERLGVDITSNTATTKDVARSILAFTGDVALDPSTYASLGTVPVLEKVLKGTTKSAAKNASKEAMEKGVRESIEELSKEKGKVILDKLGLDSSDEAVKSINDATKRFANIDQIRNAEDLKFGTKKHNVTLLKDQALREFGDKTVAPYFNKATNAIGENKYFKGFKDKFTSQQILDNRKLLTDNPEELFKQKAFKQYAYKVATTFKNKQFEFANDAIKLFEDFSPETQKLMTDIMERKEYWQNIDVKTETENITRMSANAQRMKDSLLQVKAETEELLGKYSNLEGYEKKINDAQTLLGKINKIMETTDFDFADIMTRMDDNASLVKQMPREQMQNFMNDKLFDETSIIAEKLIKSGLYSEDEAYDVAAQMRATLDADLRNVKPENRKMYNGQKDIDEITRVEGVQYPNDIVNEFDEAINKTKQYLKEYNELKVFRSLSNHYGDEAASAILNSAKIQMRKEGVNAEDILSKRADEAEQIKLRNEQIYNEITNQGKKNMQISQSIKDLLLENSTYDDFIKKSQSADVAKKIIAKKQLNEDKIYEILQKQGYSVNESYRMIRQAKEDIKHTGTIDVTNNIDETAFNKESRRMNEFDIEQPDVKRNSFVDDINAERNKPNFEYDWRMENIEKEHRKLLKDAPEGKRVNVPKIIDNFNKTHSSSITEQNYFDYLRNKKSYGEIAVEDENSISGLNYLKTDNVTDPYYVKKIITRLKEITGTPNEQKYYTHLRREIEQSVGKNESDRLFKEVRDRMKNPKKYTDESNYTSSTSRNPAHQVQTQKLAVETAKIKDAIQKGFTKDDIMKGLVKRFGQEQADLYYSNAVRNMNSTAEGWEALFNKSDRYGQERVGRAYDKLVNDLNTNIKVDEVKKPQSSFDSYYDPRYGEAAIGKSDFVPPAKEYVKTGNKQTVRNYSSNGVNMTEPLSGSQRVKPEFIDKAVKFIASRNPKFATLLNDVTVRLLDLDAAEKATFKRSTNEMMFPNNKVYDTVSNPEDFVIKNLFTHEFSHKFQTALKINNSAWEKIMGKDIAQLKFEDGIDKTVKIEEDFAESFRKYILDAKDFEKKYPERYTAINKYIDAFNRNPQDLVDNWAGDVLHQRNTLGEQAGRTMPKTAEQTVKMKETLLTNQKEKVLKDIGEGTISKDEAVKQLKQVDSDLETENFERLFKEAYPRDKIWEDVTVDKTTKKRVLNDDALKGLPINEQAKHVMQVVKENLKMWGIEEGIDEPLEDYITHILRNVDKPKKGKKPSIPKYFNPYNLQRKHAGTIKEFNEHIKKKYGVDEAFETLIGKIYMERGLRHNQLIFEKDFHEKFVDMFGERIDDLTTKHTGKRLFASTSDVVDALNKIEPMNIEEALKQLDLSDSIKDALLRGINKAGVSNINVIADYAGLNDEQYKTLLDGLNKYDKSRRTEMLKRYGLPTSLLDASEIGKSKFSMKPVVEIPERTFLLLKDKNDKFSGFTMSDASVTMLNDMGKMQVDDLRPFAIKQYDRFMRLWKLNQTSINPGFHMRNAFSNQFNNYLATGVESLKPETQIEAIKILKGYGKDSIRNFVGNNGVDEGITVKGKFISYQEISDRFNELGLRNEGAFTKDLYDNNPNAFQEISDAIKNKDSKKISLNPLNDEKFFAYKAGRAVGADVENVARMSNFIAQIKQGKDFYEAAENVNKFLFDYSELSEFEKSTMKRIIPFYTWMRKNVPLQWEQLLNQPQVYRNTGKAMQNIRNMTPEDERLEDKDVNEFAKDWVQLPFKVKGGEGNQEPVFWNPNLPYQDLNKKPSDLISSLTPAIKLPLETTTNWNWYFQSPISRGVGDTDNAPGWLQLLFNQMDDPNTKKNEAMQMNPYARHILRNLASSENASKLIEDQGVDKLISALNTFAGVKLYSYDADKYKKYAVRDRLKILQDLRKREEDKRSN